MDRSPGNTPQPSLRGLPFLSLPSPDSPIAAVYANGNNDGEEKRFTWHVVATVIHHIKSLSWIPLAASGLRHLYTGRRGGVPGSADDDKIYPHWDLISLRKVYGI